MRDYEFTVIFDANEEKTTAGLELVTQAFAEKGVIITKQDDMGVRTLAYLIKKQDKGHYVYFELQADPADIKGYEKQFLLAPQILKFLFVKKEIHAPKKKD
ncbi:30S ribosomal protein S6 [Parasphaerochaeta coccoides]|uniref:Small ribosomal subunit protein bS6 n=1 Tax=Parasphaerochaeta coccoides (strain ATCC BAA-1237 / DSM 17374 / SPN1) TaxID=760011 RepID=F4GLF8_PARC1|nr:30S ribosomal protein S6 [Parasphaerochaeta coccoides]AEC01928.1 30S ribosomal protein S6 [Parasphaerochaeta coccoides DSM 17374]